MGFNPRWQDEIDGAASEALSDTQAGAWRSQENRSGCCKKWAVNSTASGSARVGLV